MDAIELFIQTVWLFEPTADVKFKAHVEQGATLIVTFLLYWQPNSSVTVKE